MILHGVLGVLICDRTIWDTFEYEFTGPHEAEL